MSSSEKSYYEFDPSILSSIRNTKNNEIILLSNELRRDSQDTVRKLLSNEEILVVEIGSSSDQIYIVDESIDWIGPTIVFTASLITQNPKLVEFAISLISNYLTDLFATANKRSTLTVIGETKSGKFRKLKFEGPANKLKELPEILRSMYNED
jgi:hypothetical protein